MSIQIYIKFDNKNYVVMIPWVSKIQTIMYANEEVAWKKGTQVNTDKIVDVETGTIMNDDDTTVNTTMDTNMLFKGMLVVGGLINFTIVFCLYDMYFNMNSDHCTYVEVWQAYLKLVLIYVTCLFPVTCLFLMRLNNNKHKGEQTPLVVKTTSDIKSEDKYNTKRKQYILYAVLFYSLYIVTTIVPSLVFIIYDIVVLVSPEVRLPECNASYFQVLMYGKYFVFVLPHIYPTFQLVKHITTNCKSGNNDYYYNHCCNICCNFDYCNKQQTKNSKYHAMHDDENIEYGTIL